MSYNIKKEKQNHPACYGLNCVIPFYRLKSLLPVFQNMTEFGDKAFKEVTKVK